MEVKPGGEEKEEEQRRRRGRVQGRGQQRYDDEGVLAVI